MPAVSLRLTVPMIRSDNELCMLLVEFFLAMIGEVFIPVYGLRGLRNRIPSVNRQVF